MTARYTYLHRALLVAVAGSLTLAASASAQKAQTPSGWVGLSIIQSGKGKAGGAVAVGYPVIASVEPGSPAQSAGLVSGDTILSYNDIDASSDPTAVQRFLKPGRELSVKIRRNGVRQLTMTVARRTAQNVYREGVTIRADDNGTLPLMSAVPGTPIAIAASVMSGRVTPFAGSYFAKLNAGLAGALAVADAGVLVVDVGPGSAAMRAGLEAGDVITRADSIAVTSPLEIATAMQLASDNSVTLSVTRRGKARKVTISW